MSIGFLATFKAFPEMLKTNKTPAQTSYIGANTKNTGIFGTSSRKISQPPSQKNQPTQQFDNSTKYKTSNGGYMTERQRDNVYSVSNYTSGGLLDNTKDYLYDKNGKVTTSNTTYFPGVNGRSLNYEMYTTYYTYGESGECTSEVTINAADKYAPPEVKTINADGTTNTKTGFTALPQEIKDKMINETKSDIIVAKFNIGRHEEEITKLEGKMESMANDEGKLDGLKTLLTKRDELQNEQENLMKELKAQGFTINDYTAYADPDVIRAELNNPRLPASMREDLEKNLANVENGKFPADIGERLKDIQNQRSELQSDFNNNYQKGFSSTDELPGFYSVSYKAVEQGINREKDAVQRDINRHNDIIAEQRDTLAKCEDKEEQLMMPEVTIA